VTIPAHAELVQVEINGTVEYNQINFGVFGDVMSGDPVHWSFVLDSNDYLNSGNYNVRGYAIDTASFALTIGPAEVGLLNPYPYTPYFALRDNDPVADGFFFTNDNVDWPGDLLLDELGKVDYFGSHFEVGYTGDTLSSLDIVDAVGSYDFTGLTSYYTTINDGGFEAMGLQFVDMNISIVPAPASLLALAPITVIRRRRR
jgi:hypothetical protein